MPHLVDSLVLDDPKPLPHIGWDSPNDWLYAAGGLCPWIKKSYIDKDGFQLNLDVHHFALNEISVKTVDDSIVIEAKHDERADEHGDISRHFRRRYCLLEGFDVKDVVSSMSSDGILTVKASPATPILKGNVRQIQIEETGSARLKVRVKNGQGETVV